LDERCAVEHYASQKVREQILVFGETCERRGPEVRSRDCQRIAFQDSDCILRIQSEKPELAKVGDEDDSVLAEIADGLRFGGESFKVVVGWLDFYDATLGILKQFGFGIAALALGLGEEPTVGEARSAIAELGGKQDRGFEGFAGRIE
jgi:hypothetical protein